MATAITALATTTLASNAATVSFSSISQSYRDLILVMNLTASAGYNIPITLNGDTTNANYTSVYVAGDGSSASSGILANYVGGVYSGNLSTNVLHFMDYAQTDKHVNILSRLSVSTNTASAIVTRWSNTAAVTSIAFTVPGTFSAGSTFSLYGVSA